VLRAGAGIFYDLGYSDITYVMISFPYIQAKLALGTSFPLSASSAAPPPFTVSPPAAVMSVVDPNHVLPRTYEWNAAVEHSITPPCSPLSFRTRWNAPQVAQELTI
jgi:hypothetical protein